VAEEFPGDSMMAITREPTYLFFLASMGRRMEVSVRLSRLGSVVVLVLE
jgi:hypothetical protein